MTSADRVLSAHFGQRAKHYESAASWVNDVASLVPIADVVASSQPRRVLELGSGSGAVPAYLASVGSAPPLYIGLDRSMAMLSQQSGFAAAVAGDAGSIPLRSESIDLVVCRQAFHYFANPLAVLSGIARVLADRGELLIAQITPFDDPADRTWWKTAVALRQPLRRHRWTKDGLQRVLRLAGFSVQSTTHVDCRTSLASWIGRYPIEPSVRRGLVEHYRGAADAIRVGRGFVETSTDIEYTIRWTILLANVDSARSTGPVVGTSSGATCRDGCS